VLEVHFEWGLHAIDAYGDAADTVIIVDVLSFSTAVSVAVERGAVIIPYPCDYVSAPAFAQAARALLAVHRDEVTPERPYSLSPASLHDVRMGTRIVLPSPNGAACCVRASERGIGKVLIGCIHNAAATAAAVQPNDGNLLVVACGERWPDDNLRPAIEDFLGAGAIISNLETCALSSEASVVVDAYRAHANRLGEVIMECASGRELVELGYAVDVQLAVLTDASPVAAVLHDGEIVSAPVDG
jgi:2-phosphosulfolactate phosphatase